MSKLTAAQLAPWPVVALAVLRASAGSGCASMVQRASPDSPKYIYPLTGVTRYRAQQARICPHQALVADSSFISFLVGMQQLETHIDLDSVITVGFNCLICIL